jgi:hypothetical protein
MIRVSNVGIGIGKVASHDRTEAGVFDAGRGCISGEGISIGESVFTEWAGHGADDGHPIGAGGASCQGFGKVNAGDCGGDRSERSADFGGRVDFGIPHFEVAGSAIEPK